MQKRVVDDPKILHSIVKLAGLKQIIVHDKKDLYALPQSKLLGTTLFHFDRKFTYVGSGGGGNVFKSSYNGGDVAVKSVRPADDQLELIWREIALMVYVWL